MYIYLNELFYCDNIIFILKSIIQTI